MSRTPRLLPRVAMGLLCAAGLFLALHQRSVHGGDGGPDATSTALGIATGVSLLGLYIVVCWPMFRYPRNTGRPTPTPDAETRKSIPIRYAMLVWSTAETYLEQLAMAVSADDFNSHLSGVPTRLSDNADPKVRKFHRLYDEALRRHYDGNKTESFEFFSAVERATASYEDIMRRESRKSRHR